jgi:acyl-CoA synthetase (AMP-forming)/AMP-acid ligase II
MLDGRGLLTGQPESCVELRIIHDRWGKPIGPFKPVDFENHICARNEPGEIVVTGDHVIKGYVNGRGDDETKFKVDEHIWHRTGDAGYLDESGRLWLLGRCEAKIDDEHGELYPFAVECAASHRDDVRRSALVSIDQQRLLAIETDSVDAIEAVKTSLAWAELDDVRAFDALPVDKRHNAKIDYPKLRAILKTND